MVKKFLHFPDHTSSFAVTKHAYRANRTTPGAQEEKKKITLPSQAGGRVAPMGSWGSRGTPRP
eukprot:8237374-Pyramimonas_sp.AAC.1